MTNMSSSAAKWRAPRFTANITAQEIDDEVKRIIDEALQDRARTSSTTNRDKLELIAKSLLEYETLDGAQVEEIVRTGKFTPPPPTPQVESAAWARRPARRCPKSPPKPAPPKLPGLGIARARARFDVGS